MEYFKFLPVEMKLEILSRTPTESVLRCKLVCKTWRNLVGHPLFSKMHFRHLNQADNDSGELSFFALTYELEYISGDFAPSIPKYHYLEYNEKHESTPIERIRRVHSTLPFNCFVGSCNGLICLAGEQPHHRTVCIFNPVIKEYVMLPEINTDYSYINDVSWMSGFGYVSATNEYKVVRIYKLKNKFVEVWIYTLGGGSGWRNLGKLDPCFSPRDWEQGVFANGALHWMGDELGMIVTFDLAAEKFCQHLSPPPLPPNGYWSLNRMGVLNGILFFAIYGRGNYYHDLWLLKKKNGNHGMKEGEENLCLGWSKEFKVVNSTKLVAVTKSNGILTYIDMFLYIYNTKALNTKKLFDFNERILVVFPHKNTLVSLKEMGEEDTKIMESIIEDTESHDQPLLQL